MPEISNTEVIASWGNAPRTAVEGHGDEGDFARQHLLNPVLLRLLGNVQHKHILDAGCGQGYLCRMLAKQGAVVAGVEPATAFYDYAVEREQNAPLGITYVQEDLATWTPGEPRFDAVIANMVFMDIPDYRQAMQNCITALKPGGTFIFSIIHPCFEEDSATWNTKGFVTVSEYFQELAIPSTYGYCFHRSLSTYLNLVMRTNCTLREIVEPQLSQELVEQYGEAHARNAHVPQFFIVHATKNS